MAFSIFRTPAAAPSAPQFSHRKPPLTPTEVRPFQARCKVDSEPETPNTLSLSRRDAMLALTTMSVAGVSMSSPETAEARISKAEMKLKIMEKLQQLREKAGLSKKQESNKGKLPPPPPSVKKENKKLPLEPALFPLPNPPHSGGKSMVEVTLL